MHNGFIALHSMARVFNSVEQDGVAFFASERSVFDAGEGLKLARSNLCFVIEHLSMLASALETVIATSRPYGEADDISAWKKTHKQRHAAALRHAQTAATCIEGAMSALEAYRKP